MLNYTVICNSESWESMASGLFHVLSLNKLILSLQSLLQGGKKVPLEVHFWKPNKGAPSPVIGKTQCICSELHLLCENPTVFWRPHSSCLAIGPSLLSVQMRQSVFCLPRGFIVFSAATGSDQERKAASRGDDWPSQPSCRPCTAHPPRPAGSLGVFRSCPGACGSRGCGAPARGGLQQAAPASAEGTWGHLARVPASRAPPQAFEKPPHRPPAPCNFLPGEFRRAGALDFLAI